jgi:hypothetical protein
LQESISPSKSSEDIKNILLKSPIFQQFKELQQELKTLFKGLSSSQDITKNITKILTILENKNIDTQALKESLSKLKSDLMLIIDLDIDEVDNIDPKLSSQTKKLKSIIQKLQTIIKSLPQQKPQLTSKQLLDNFQNIKETDLKFIPKDEQKVIQNIKHIIDEVLTKSHKLDKPTQEVKQIAKDNSNQPPKQEKIIKSDEIIKTYQLNKAEKTIKQDKISPTIKADISKADTKSDILSKIEISKSNQNISDTPKQLKLNQNISDTPKPIKANQNISSDTPKPIKANQNISSNTSNQTQTNQINQINQTNQTNQTQSKSYQPIPSSYHYPTQTPKQEIIKPNIQLSTQLNSDTISQNTKSSDTNSQFIKPQPSSQTIKSPTSTPTTLHSEVVSKPTIEPNIFNTDISTNSDRIIYAKTNDTTLSNLDTKLIDIDKLQTKLKEILPTLKDIVTSHKDNNYLSKTLEHLKNIIADTQSKSMNEDIKSIKDILLKVINQPNIIKISSTIPQDLSKTLIQDIQMLKENFNKIDTVDDMIKSPIKEKIFVNISNILRNISQIKPSSISQDLNILQTKLQDMQVLKSSIIDTNQAILDIKSTINDISTIKIPSNNPNILHLQNILKSTQKDISSLDKEAVKELIANSGIFYESKLKEAVTTNSAISTQTDPQTKLYSQPQNNIDFAKDLKVVLLKLQEEVKKDDTVFGKALSKHIDKLLLHIDYYQLLSYTTNNTHIFLPFLWDKIEDGHLQLKRLKKDKFYCEVELKFIEYGDLRLSIMLYHQNYIDISFFVQNQEFKKMLQQDISKLKQNTQNTNLKINNIKILDI